MAEAIIPIGGTTPLSLACVFPCDKLCDPWGFHGFIIAKFATKCKRRVLYYNVYKNRTE